MNDIRPPAQLLTGAPSTNGAGNGTRTQEDPAAAFDAVMARYSAKPSQPPAPSRAQAHSDRRVENRNDHRNESAASRERSSAESRAEQTQAAPAQPARSQRGENKRDENNDAAGADTRAGAPNAKPGTSEANGGTAEAADDAAGEANAAAEAQPAVPVAQAATALPAELLATLGANAQAAEGGAVTAETLVAAGGEAAADSPALETMSSTEAQARDGKTPAAAVHDAAHAAAQSCAAGRPADDAPAAADKTSLSTGDKSAAVLAAQFAGNARTAGAARAEQAAAAAAAGGAEATVTAPVAPGALNPLTAAPVAAATVTPAQAAPTFSIAHAHIATPVAQPGFAQDFGDRVVLFVNQRVQHAELSLTPAELGPVNVTIEVRGQEASLSFAAASGTSRAAIEDALPRLREMLAGAGLQLANAHVGDQSRRESGRGYRPGGSPAVQLEGIQIVGTTAGGARPRGSHLIDVIA